ncbi:uncharacterized protein LOC120571172 isoform X1 [Perca fluviatilis]|uniref:uncharacterized protein LOC120571172 isoform X1 n=1 Tax=Perca fluviatilis TaxID=8168 RepID=UPI001963DF50|nr:uncharacterized protein LOC120571172 isoform X1 [Perca fluviatilis]
MFPGVFYALLAGFLGAVASSSAKLSLGADYLKGVCETGLRTWGEQRKFRQADETTACDRLHIPLRLLCGGLLFTCNAVMWTFLAKALRYSSSSTQTTVTTTASNFISSGCTHHAGFCSSGDQTQPRRSQFSCLCLYVLDPGCVTLLKRIVKHFGKVRSED